MACVNIRALWPKVACCYGSMGRGRRLTRARADASRGPHGGSSVTSVVSHSPSYSPQQSRYRTDIASTPISNRPGQSPPLFEDTSPSHNSPSPIPFMCTQDGSHGENDVIWDYYSPASRKEQFNHTPIRKRKGPVYYDQSPISRISTKKKLLRHENIKKDFFKGLKEELVTLNKHVQELVSSDSNTPSEKYDGDVNIALTPVRKQSTQVDIFDDSIMNAIIECAQTSDDKFKNMQPLKAHITDKISKCNNEVLESDDSMNEYLLKASQMVEDEFQKNDEIVEPEVQCRNKHLFQVDSTNAKNDSFDNLISGINDSYIDGLTQVCDNNRNINEVINKNQNIYKPLKNLENKPTIRKKELEVLQNEKFNLVKCDKNIKMSDDSLNLSSLLTNSIFHDSTTKFSRHNSMPVSPIMKSNQNISNNRISTFSRHKSMPSDNNQPMNNGIDGSQSISCTPEEIRKKHQAAKEKLLSKKHDSHIKISKNILPQSGLAKNTNIVLSKNFEKLQNNTKENTSTNENNVSNNIVVASNSRNLNLSLRSSINQNKHKDCERKTNIQAEIERKRKEALQKLQKKKLQLQRLIGRNCF